MQDAVVSLNGNVLKVIAIQRGNLLSVVKEVPKEIVDDTKITDVNGFSALLEDAIKELTVNAKAKYRLNFVLEPTEAVFKFVTISKETESTEARIIDEIKGKLDGVELNDLYFSYVKIAPFVYQFVGVDKELLEKYLQVSANLRLELHSILPWAMLLPKYVGSNTSSIFVCGIGKKPTVVLSELGGVFFVGTYDEREDPSDLYKLVQELSVYKRAKPIDKVYTFNYPYLKQTEEFMVHSVEIPNAGDEQTVGFETALLVKYMLDLAPDTPRTQINMLNLLPVPVVVKRQLPTAVIIAPISVLILALTIFGGVNFLAKNRSQEPLQNNGQVLSETTVETTQSTQSQPVVPQGLLEKKDLVVRVENGSGVNGIAAKTKELLEGFGYKVISIDTAEQSRDDTLLRFKTSKAFYKDTILGDLKDKFPNTKVEEGVDAESEYDLLIIIGTSQKL